MEPENQTTIRVSHKIPEENKEIRGSEEIYGHLLFTLEGHTDSVSSVSISPRQPDTSEWFMG